MWLSKEPVLLQTNVAKLLERQQSEESGEQSDSSTTTSPQAVHA